METGHKRFFQRNKRILFPDGLLKTLRLMKCKNRLLLLLMLVTGNLLQAQVSMTLQVPPSGVVQKNQLWNMVLVNNGNQPIVLGVDLTLLSTVDNRPVMTASSRQWQMAKGVLQLKPADLAPIQYNYLSSIFNVDLNPNGLLPIGNFIACYSVYTKTDKQKVPLVEDCVPVEVQPLSPPLLNLPANEAVVETAYPQFNWLPPAPLQLFNNLSYDFILVQVNKGQSITEAIQQNIPVYNAHHLDKSFLNYPASNKSLDTGRIYAWSIVARNNGQFVAQSETWTFRVKALPSYASHREISTYIKLKRGLDASLAVCSGDIGIEYVNATNDSTVQFSIKSLDDGRNTLVTTGILPVKAGQNFVLLPPASTRRLEDNKNYLLELVNARREIWSVKLLYYKEDYR
jgi:hypothetical protein